MPYEHVPIHQMLPHTDSWAQRVCETLECQTTNSYAPSLAGQMTDASWMFAGIALLTSDGYQRTPFSWGGSPQSVRYKGSADHRAAALQEARIAFADVQWLDRETA